MIDPNRTTAQTYEHLASQAGIIANEVYPRGHDDQYKEQRLVIVTYLRMAASRLRELSAAKSIIEKS
jgi:hypothetical protein